MGRLYDQLLPRDNCSLASQKRQVGGVPLSHTVYIFGLVMGGGLLLALVLLGLEIITARLLR